MEERKGLECIEECLPLLLSGDWKKRLIGEYWETKIRSAALKEYIERRTEEEHKWNESMEHHIMSRQLSDMLGYLSCLGLRAAEKDIDLMDTELPEDEYFVQINGKGKNRQVQIDGFSVMCLYALLDVVTRIAISTKNEDFTMEEFITRVTEIFAEGLHIAAQEQEGSGCK